MKVERRWLVDAIRNRLLPELIRREFEVIPLQAIRSGPIDREFIVSLPFGLLRRRGERGLEQIEIQLGSSGRASFSINCGVIPEGGVDGVRGHIDANEALVTWLDEFYILYSSARRSSPFAIRRWWWGKAVAQADYDALVGRTAELLPEVEKALVEGVVGPHIRRIKKGRAH